MSVERLERRGLSYSPRGLSIRRSRFRIMDCAFKRRISYRAVRVDDNTVHAKEPAFKNQITGMLGMELIHLKLTRQHFAEGVSFVGMMLFGHDNDT